MVRRLVTGIALALAASASAQTQNGATSGLELRIGALFPMRPLGETSKGYEVSLGPAVTLGAVWNRSSDQRLYPRVVLDLAAHFGSEATPTSNCTVFCKSSSFQTLEAHIGADVVVRASTLSVEKTYVAIGARARAYAASESAWSLPAPSAREATI